MDRDVSTDTKKKTRPPINNRMEINTRTRIGLLKAVKRFERYRHVADAKDIVRLVESGFAGVNDMPDMVEHPVTTKLRVRAERKAAKAEAKPAGAGA